MSKITGGTLTQVLELRKKNGLEATKEALNADLESSKAKWTLEETPRYRKAGDSPIYVSGKYLTKAGTCPATGEKDAGRASSSPATAKSRTPHKQDASVTSAPSEETFLRVLHGRGFKVRVAKNLLTEEIEREVPSCIENLGLKFSAIPARTEDVHITQTTPQIQVAMSLDKFLELAGIKA